MRRLREFLNRNRRKVGLVGVATAAVFTTAVIVAPAASAPRVNLTAAASAGTGSCSWTDDASGDLNVSCTPATTPTTQPPATTTTTVPPTTTTTVPPTTTTTTPPPPPAKQILGVYNGGLSSAQSLGKTLGLSPLTGFSYYCDGTSWSSISSCGPPSGLPTGTTALVGVDLTPNNTGLSAVAGNVWAFQSLARHFIGTPTVVRLGWEFDGSWMPWGNGANGNTPSQFASATSLVIPAMKAIDPALKFDFSDNTGTSSLAQLKVYMGNNAGLWNYVGGDHYDNRGGGGNASQLTASVQLASQLGKPLSIGEWGLNGADDPNFINTMAKVILNPASASAANGWPTYTVGPTSYFSADLQINSAITQFPNSVAAFKLAFG